MAFIKDGKLYCWDGDVAIRVTSSNWAKTIAISAASKKSALFASVSFGADLVNVEAARERLKETLFFARSQSTNFPTTRLKVSRDLHDYRVQQRLCADSAVVDRDAYRRRTRIDTFQAWAGVS